MKKLSLATLVILFALSVNAQVQFGLKAGLNFPNWSVKESGSTAPDTKIGFGFHLGGIVDIPVSSNFSIQPGALFSVKGFKADVNMGTTVNTTTKLNYIEVPINAMLKVGEGDTKFLVFGGPYLGYGLGGTVKAEAQGRSATSDITFGSGDNDVNPLDFGINLGAGIKFNKIMVTAQYGIGLANLSNSSGETVHNNVIGVSVALLFGGK